MLRISHCGPVRQLVARDHYNHTTTCPLLLPPPLSQIIQPPSLLPPHTLMNPDTEILSWIVEYASAKDYPELINGMSLLKIVLLYNFRIYCLNNNFHNIG